MLLEQIPTAGDRNLGYLIADSERKLAMVVDPSGAPEKFIARIEELGLVLQWIVCTHYHHDHVGGWKELKSRYGAGFGAHETSPLPVDHTLTDGQEITIGSVAVRILHTPGHSEDSICLYLPGYLVTGDTLFVGKVGGTDFGEGARRQYDSLHRKLLVLPDETVIYPGHDYGVRPRSTIGDEKRENPFLLQPDFEHFVELKRNWLAYKAEHGIP